VLPQLREIERRHPDAIAIVGVHSGKFIAERETARIAAASERLGVTHPVVNDRQFRVWRSFAVRAWPTLVAIDAGGAVIGMHAGEFTADSIEPFLRRALAGSPATTPGPRAERALPDAPRANVLRFPAKVDVEDGRIAIADSAHHRVLIGRLDLARGEIRVERAVGGARGSADGDAARFDGPQGVRFDGARLLVADAGNHAVRAISLDDGITRTLAGTGRQLRTHDDFVAGALSSPWDVVRAGDRLVVAMAGIHRLWEIDDATSRARPMSGTGAEALHDGTHAEAAYAQPMGLAVSPSGALLVADAESSAIRHVSPEPDGTVHTLVGTGLFDFGDRDGTADAARLQHPQGIAVDRTSGRVLVADSYNDCLRWIDPVTRACTTWVRGLHEPGGVALTSTHAIVADTNAHRVVAIDLVSTHVQPLTLVDAT
jgi:hypothetical protein